MWKKLRKIGEGSKSYITCDWKELIFMIFLLLNPKYLPHLENREQIRGKELREEIYSGRIDFALKKFMNQQEIF